MNKYIYMFYALLCSITSSIVKQLFILRVYGHVSAFFGSLSGRLDKFISLGHQFALNSSQRGV